MFEKSLKIFYLTNAALLSSENVVYADGPCGIAPESARTHII